MLNARTNYATVLCLLGAVLGSSVTAQRTVWPPGYATMAGGSSQELPFSLPDQVDGARSLVLMTSDSLHSIRGMTLGGIAFRRDAMHPENYAGFECKPEIRLGPIASATRLPSPTTAPFSAPPTRTAWGDYDVPGAPAGSGLPPFSMAITFRVPYVYAGGDLGMDMIVRRTSQTPASTLWRRDAVLPGRGNEAFARTRGTATPGTIDPPRYRLLAWVESEELHPGGRLISRAEQAPNLRGMPALHYIGLPTDLPLSPIGFPAGTNLYSSGLETSFAQVADMSKNWGRATQILPIPNDPGLAGARLTSQWFVLDPSRLAPLPILASAGVDWQIGRLPRGEPRYGRTIWGRGPDNPAAAFAARVSPPDYVPVLEFR